MAEDGFPEVLNSLGLAGHSLVLFWKFKSDDEGISSHDELKSDDEGISSYDELKSDDEGISSSYDELKSDDEGISSYDEVTLDPKKYYIIGCDEEDATNLSRYRTHFAGSTINIQKEGGVIDRVHMNEVPEMSPNISYYSEDEYPHRDFALTCGIRASFCFPFSGPLFKEGVMEIVSTCNQEVGVVRKLCECIEEKLGLRFYHLLYTVSKYEYAIPELDRLLEEVCQKFHLPLTQYYGYGVYDDVKTVLQQLSYRDYENLAPWCHFKDACFHMPFGYPLDNCSESHEAFFCKDISALSITQYPSAHYARNCGSIAYFTIFLFIISPEEIDAETDEEIDKEYVLEFFLPSQEMDNDSYFYF